MLLGSDVEAICQRSALEPATGTPRPQRMSNSPRSTTNSTKNVASAVKWASMRVGKNPKMDAARGLFNRASQRLGESGFPRAGRWGAQRNTALQTRDRCPVLPLADPGSAHQHTAANPDKGFSTSVNRSSNAGFRFSGDTINPLKSLVPATGLEPVTPDAVADE